jgi:hypothetical protein
MIVVALNKTLPPRYVAAPRIHHGAFAEVDVSAWETDKAERPAANGAEGDGGVATAVWAPARPTLAFETDLPDADEYEVQIYDLEDDRRLVAAVEIVSPANKDRPEHRRKFVAKCVALLQNRVSVAVVDVVTERSANLYRELLDLIGRSETPPGAEAPLYAVECRCRELRVGRSLFETWEQPLTVGRPLPTLPLWLTDDLAVPLDLEASYEETCRGLRIG